MMRRLQSMDAVLSASDTRLPPDLRDTPGGVGSLALLRFAA